MKKAYLVVLAIFAGVIGIISGILVYSHILIIGIQEIPTTITVMDAIGIDTNTSGVIFGGVNPGGTSKRQVFLSQHMSDHARVKIQAFGEFRDWIEVSEPYFSLKRNEGKKIDFIAKVPLNATRKDYSGRIIVIYQKAFW